MDGWMDGWMGEWDEARGRRGHSCETATTAATIIELLLCVLASRRKTAAARSDSTVQYSTMQHAV